MQTLDIAFLQQYIQLDTLLGKMFPDGGGVSTYLEAMEDEASTARAWAVPDWDEDYHTLRHLRHLRNKITHEPSEDGFCTEEDLEALRRFYQRALQRDDPFVRWDRCRREAGADTPPRRDSRLGSTIFLILVFLAFAAALYFNLLK